MCRIQRRAEQWLVEGDHSLSVFDFKCFVHQAFLKASQRENLGRRGIVPEQAFRIAADILR
uniref:Uncharacterized protein n=1 Tax=Pseudomonas aeruginosa TaxID=287 RepID=B3G1S9_PSEAI|nr:hypothetical protein PACL_0203 [Pseudomonas aeruginosa]